ncbi:cytochrome P450 [Sinomonas albida]|uniref:cytochrome P450 n=1 Tax=Sinomonas albida TaxID=369942 RepID=UPI0010A8851E|nr:cytochrome P450 [Sinomonas albida]
MIPRLGNSTLALWKEGYTFVSARCDELGADVFRTRLLLRPVYCMRGAEAVSVFYDEERFGRAGSVPHSAQHLLQDEGSVQSLTGAAHHGRKALFLTQLTDASVKRLAEIFAEEWRAALPGWARQRRIVLDDEVRLVLTKAACRWAGLPLDEATAGRRSAEFGLMVDESASFGPSNWYARRRRQETERWAAQALRELRSAGGAPDRSVAAAVALHRDEDGELLPDAVAAVELLNFLRPIVAVGRFITFAAVALAQHPEWRAQVAEGSEDDRLAFAQEVRRYFPFFPFVGGTVRKPFDWEGHRFEEGEWALLDLYGTNHDPRLWENPESFDPERFRGWTPDAQSLVPQGGGDVHRGHRCPGESTTLELLKAAAHLLAEPSGFSLPAQDLTVDLAHIPAVPRSRVILTTR